MVQGAASDRQFSQPLQMQGLQPCRLLLLLSCVAAVARAHRPDRPTVRPPVNMMNESLLMKDAESSVPAKLLKQNDVHEEKEATAASHNATSTPSNHQATVLLQTNSTDNASKVETNATHVEKAPTHDKGKKHKDGSMKLIKDRHEEPVHPAIARMREQRKNGIRPAGRRHLAQVSTGTGGVLMQTSHPKKKEPEASNEKEKEPAVKESAEHTPPGKEHEKDDEKQNDNKVEKKNKEETTEKDGVKKSAEDDAALEPPHDHEEHHHKHHHHHHHHHGGAHGHGKHHKHTITEEEGDERASESASEEEEEHHAHHRRHGPIVHNQALHMLVLLVLLSLGIAGVAMLVKLWREEILRDVTGSGDGHGAAKPIIAKKSPPVPQRADGLVTITKLPTMAETACQQDSG